MTRLNRSLAGPEVGRALDGSIAGINNPTPKAGLDLPHVVLNGAMFHSECSLLQERLELHRLQYSVCPAADSDVEDESPHAALQALGTEEGETIRGNTGGRGEGGTVPTGQSAASTRLGARSPTCTSP